MRADLVVGAIKRAEGGAWVCLMVDGESARVRFANGEVRSAIGIRELRKVLGVVAHAANCK